MSLTRVCAASGLEGGDEQVLRDVQAETRFDGRAGMAAGHGFVTASVSGKSSQTTTGEMAALSLMEQSAEMDGRLLPLVPSTSRPVG